MKHSLNLLSLVIAAGTILTIYGCGGGGSAAPAVAAIPAVAIKGSTIYSADPTSNVSVVTSDVEGNAQITYKQTIAGLFDSGYVSPSGDVFIARSNASGDLISLNINNQYKLAVKTLDSNGKPLTYELTGIDIQPTTIAPPTLAANTATSARLASAPAKLFLSEHCPKYANMDASNSQGLDNNILDYVCQVSTGVTDSQPVVKVLDWLTGTVATTSTSNRIGGLISSFAGIVKKIVPFVTQIAQRNSEITTDSQLTQAEKLKRLKLETGLTISSTLPSTTDAEGTEIALARAALALNSGKREEHLLDNYGWNKNTGTLISTPTPTPTTAQTAYTACYAGTPALYTAAYCTAYANAIAAGNTPTVANQKGAAAAGSNVGNIGMGGTVTSVGTPAAGTSNSTSTTYQTAYDACYSGTPALYTSTYCAAYATAIAAGSTPTTANQKGATAAGSNVGNIGMGGTVTSTGTPSTSNMGDTTTSTAHTPGSYCDYGIGLTSPGHWNSIGKTCLPGAPSGSGTTPSGDTNVTTMSNQQWHHDYTSKVTSTGIVTSHPNWEKIIPGDVIVSRLGSMASARAFFTNGTVTSYTPCGQCEVGSSITIRVDFGYIVDTHIYVRDR